MRLLLVFFLLPLLGFGQQMNDIPINDTLYSFVTHEPEFPGGMQGMQQWIVENINYPEKAIENNEEGNVFIRYIVNKDGSISNIRVLKGEYESLNNEAIRLVSAMPKWNPGKLKSGEVVAVEFTLPLRFGLGSSHTKKEEEQPVEEEEEKETKKKRKRRK